MKPVVQMMSGQAAAWIYEKPTRGGKMQLLTIGCVSVTGDWKGELGEMFLAWSPLLKRDKQKEANILAKRKPRVTHDSTPKPVEHVIKFSHPASGDILEMSAEPHCKHGKEICSYSCTGQAKGECRGHVQWWNIEVHHYVFRDSWRRTDTHVATIAKTFVNRLQALTWAKSEYPTAFFIDAKPMVDEDQ